MSGKMTSETEVDMMFSKKFKFKEVQLTSSVQLDLSWMVRLLIFSNVSSSIMVAVITFCEYHARHVI